MLAGAAGAYGVCQATGWGDSGEDPCLGPVLIGGLAGSILGAATGVHLAGRGFTPFSKAITSALGATVAATGAAYLIGRASDAPGPIIIGFVVTQGMLTALLTRQSGDH